MPGLQSSVTFDDSRPHRFASHEGLRYMCRQISKCAVKANNQSETSLIYSETHHDSFWQRRDGKVTHFLWCYGGRDYRADPISD